MHPLLQLITTQPALVAEHAEAYAALLGDEIGAASAQWKLRAALLSVAYASAAVAAVLWGVAAMLWAVTPPDEIHAAWVLWLAPAVPLAVTLACVLIARRRASPAAFDTMRRQIQEDMAMWREASAS